MKKAMIKKIEIPAEKRVICISDIHGNLNLFKRLLEKVEYSDEDILMLLGDIYAKGNQGHETLQCVMELSKSSNVSVLRGNCDQEKEYMTADEKVWLNSLPHVIESQDYLFVHGGLTSDNLQEQDAASCMKMDAFMEQGLKFSKYVITGHWPVVNYTHDRPCCNPIVNKENKTIAIDGGCVLNRAGQLNAFLIYNGVFSSEYVDDLPIMQVESAQPASSDSLNITWLDRFIEILTTGEEFSLYRHIQSGKKILLPTKSIWTDRDGNLCGCGNCTDYDLPVDAGDSISVVEVFSSRILVKKNGTLGWIKNIDR